MRRLITFKYVKSLSPCYDDTRLRRLLRKPVTVRDVLARRSVVPYKDRLWLVLRPGLIPARTRLLFAVDCAERALLRECAAGREPHVDSWRAVEVVRGFARGARTEMELGCADAATRAAARAAARAADYAAADTAYVAAYVAAAAAARAAASAAADAARARTAEHRWQVQHLLSLLSKPKPKPKSKSKSKTVRRK